jgi:hypothetical protein
MAKTLCRCTWDENERARARPPSLQLVIKTDHSWSVPRSVLW